MKKRLKTISVIVFCFIGLLIITGCGGGPTPATSATVTVQLTKGDTNYAVNQMTVTIQKTGGQALTGVTNSNGIASFTVSATGNYSVVKVDGVDATSLAQGSEGREFVKSAPLADPFPNLSYTVTGVSINVSAFGDSYPVNVTVPAINKITVLKKDTAAADPSTHSNLSISAGTEPFNGRLVFTNLSFDDQTYNITSYSTHANSNCIALSPGSGTPVIKGAHFWGGPSWTGTNLDASGELNGYLAAGPIYFEAPGGGDWALGYNNSGTGLITRQDCGGADVTRDFPAFDGGGMVFCLYYQGVPTANTTFSVDYSILKFDTL